MRPKILSFATAAFIGATILTSGCGIGKPDTVGSIERIDPALDNYIAPGAKMEVLADGFGWSEGPVWVPGADYLLFTDVPGNILYKWDEEEGLSEFLNPSGLPAEEASFSRAPGANGLIMGEEFNHIYIANHSKRAIIAMDLRSKGETVLANNFEGKKFSSPNDLVLSNSGSVYFTDPPFGLNGTNASPDKEISVNGVYRLDPDGFTYRIIDDLSLPNGVDLSPDEKTLYVLVSDGPYVMAYDLSPEGNVTNPRKFYDYSLSIEAGKEGSPDGLDVAADGTLYLTGPGGVHVVTSTGNILGIIDPGSRIANVTIGENGTMLYMTAHTRLLRMPIKKSEPL